jgi:2-deoxy-D-gluconate 3-dehydrogenase
MPVLEGRTAVVTGAGRGIGRAVAVALARAGASVVLASRSPAELAETADEVAGGGGRPALVAPTDVTDPGQVEDLFERAAEVLGQPSVLVSCAGQLLERRLVETTDAEWAGILSTNLTSAFYVCRAFARPLLASRQPGRIVIVSSAFGHVGVSGYAAYSASKAALDGLTRALAVEWASAAIGVNSVAPGHLHTAMTAAAFADPATVRYVVGRIPAGRMPRPDEVADLVTYLVSPSAELITGQSILIDGGYTIR